MVVRQGQPTGVEAMPEEFRAAVASMKAARLRPEVVLSDMRAPQRIAPHSFALSADVNPGVDSEDDEDAGTGRLILLHDPDGNEAWHGTFRCVTYVRAALDPEHLEDGLVGGVAWSWLTDALQSQDLRATALSGTVTTVTSESFGSIAEEAPSHQVEIRASWTPLLDERRPMAAHVQAWGDLLCTAVGLAPVPEGIAALPNRRAPREP